MSTMGKYGTSVVARTTSTTTTFMGAQTVGLLGTDSSAFVDARLYQLQAAARPPSNGTYKLGVGSSLAMIEPAKPKNEVEGALALQIALPHTAAMAVQARLGGGSGSERGVAAHLRLGGQLVGRTDVRSEVGTDTPLRLDVATALACPGGSMTAGGVAKGRRGIKPSGHSGTMAFLRA